MTAHPGKSIGLDIKSGSCNTTYVYDINTSGKGDDVVA